MKKPLKYFLTIAFVLILVLTYDLVNQKLTDRCGAYNYAYSNINSQNKDPMSSCDKEIFCHVVKGKRGNAEWHNYPTCRPFYNYKAKYFLPDFIL